MIRASVALLVLCLIAIGVLSTYSVWDGGTLKFSDRNRIFGSFAEADLPAHESSPDKPTALPAALQEDPQLNEAWHYTEYGERSAAEPVDPDWAPQMEATLDSLIRSMGSPVGDVKEVECRTTKCRAVVLFQPSLFLIMEEERNETVVAFFDEFNLVMEPVIQASTRFTKTTGVALVHISEERPNETNIWDTVGAFLYVAGRPLGDSPL